jgi:hypothetical protein
VTLYRVRKRLIVYFWLICNEEDTTVQYIELPCTGTYSFTKAIAYILISDFLLLYVLHFTVTTVNLAKLAFSLPNVTKRREICTRKIF